MPSICLLYGFAVALGGFPAAKAFGGARHLSQKKSAGQGEPGRRGGVVSGSGGGWTFDPVMGEHLLGVFP